MSVCSSTRAALVAGTAFLLGSCGREDIELAHRAAMPSSGGSGGSSAIEQDCRASVPPDLLAPRPPMGWNGYNAFECAPELDEVKVKANIDALIASGMQAAGYQFVNLDKCWQGPRSPDGRRTFDPVRLPGGIAALSDFIHQRGLSLGIFAPTHDCLDAPGGADHEAVDVASYTAWGVDYVKYVSCETGAAGEDAVVNQLARELATAARPMLLSITNPPFAEWMPEASQVWRTGANAAPIWETIVEAIDTTTPLAAYARPGGFNDPDVLEIGNGALSEGEQRVQFSVWSILAAPLLAGNDLSVMNESVRTILTNTEVIELNQDPLALQAAVLRRDGGVDILAKPLADCGARGVVLWNRETTPQQVNLTWNDLWLAPGSAKVRDLWSHSELVPEPDGISVSVPGHDAVALRVVGVEPPLPSGEVFLSDIPWSYAVNGHGPPELDTSNGENAPGDGLPLRLRGAAHDKGLGVHGPSLVRYRLGQACSRFTADVGIDDETAGKGSASFHVFADGLELFDSGLMTGATPPKRVNVDLTGRRDLRLFVGVGGDDFQFDHGNWAGARLSCDRAP